MLRYCNAQMYMPTTKYLYALSTFNYYASISGLLLICISTLPIWFYKSNVSSNGVWIWSQERCSTLWIENINFRSLTLKWGGGGILPPSTNRAIPSLLKYPIKVACGNKPTCTCTCIFSLVPWFSICITF